MLLLVLWNSVWKLLVVVKYFRMECRHLSIDICIKHELEITHERNKKRQYKHMRIVKTTNYKTPGTGCTKLNQGFHIQVQIFSPIDAQFQDGEEDWVTRNKTTDLRQANSQTFSHKDMSVWDSNLDVQRLFDQ